MGAVLSAPTPQTRETWGRPRREANEWLAELVLYSNLKLHATAYTYYEIPRMLCARTKIRHNLGAPE